MNTVWLKIERKQQSALYSLVSSHLTETYFHFEDTLVDKADRGLEAVGAEVSHPEGVVGRGEGCGFSGARCRKCSRGGCRGAVGTRRWRQQRRLHARRCRPLCNQENRIYM